MAKYTTARGQTGNIAFVFLPDSASTTGGGKTALTNASAGLNITVRREKSSTVTTYTGANIGTITTLGTWADPGAGKCNFKEIDATNLPGLYEVHLVDLLAGTSDTSRKLLGMVTATGIAPTPFEVALTSLDIQDGVRGGMSALPSNPPGGSGGLLTAGTGAGQINPNGSGKVPATLNATDVTGDLAANVMQFSGNAVVIDGNGVPNVNTADIGGTSITSSPSGYLSVNVAYVGSQIVSLDANNLLSVNAADLGGATAATSTIQSNLSTLLGEVIRSGTAQAGGASTITLDAGASATNNFYVGQRIRITSGTGAGQSRIIIAYTGASKVATVDWAWITQPTSSSVFSVVDANAPAINSSAFVQADLQTIKGQVVTATGAFSFDAQATAQTNTASIKTTIGTAGAGLTSIPYTGPSVGTIQSGLATSASQTTIISDVTALGSPMQAGTAVTLASNGLDSISTASPFGTDFDSYNFRQQMLWGVRREAHAVYDSNAGTIKVYDAAGNLLSTQTASLSAGVQSVLDPG